MQWQLFSSEGHIHGNLCPVSPTLDAAYYKGTEMFLWTLKFCTHCVFVNLETITSHYTLDRLKA